MAVGLPLKTTYADGDVYKASDVNDTNGTINLTAAPYAAGKNKIINGDFYVNQRGFSSTTTSGYTLFDRFTNDKTAGTYTLSSQAFTAGTAPVAGYEGKQYIRCVTTGQSASTDWAYVGQRIESVRTLAGQTGTVSFWAKASASSQKMAVCYGQDFGTGGSSAVYNSTSAQTITTSWARYSFTISFPSISGKTVGSAGDYLFIGLFTSAGTGVTGGLPNFGLQNTTIDIWGVQVEAGSTATAFQTATGTIQGELAACQRYYWRWVTGGTSTAWIQNVFNYSSTVALGSIKLPVTMRVNPTSIDVTATAADYRLLTGSTVSTCSAVPVLDTSNFESPVIRYTVASGLTVGQGGIAGANSTNNAYIGFNAEL